MSRLRHIAIHVEEPKPGRYAWVLTEGDRGDWRALDRAGQPASSYHQAMAQGLMALQALVDDLERGPRETSATADAAPADTEPPGAQAQGAAAAGKSHFGFGPAR